MAKKKAGAPNGPIYEPFDRYYNQTTIRSSVKESLFYLRLTELAQSRFVWTGVPPEIDVRYLESCLHFQALAVFWFDDELAAGKGGHTPFEKYFCLPAAQSGRVNMYQNPTEFTISQPGLISRRIMAKDCVPIWNSRARVPDDVYITQYVERLNRIDSVIQENIETQRHPFLIAVDEDERHSLQQAYRQMQAGEPVIWTTPSLGAGIFEQKVSVINMQVPSQQILDMLTAKARIWNECMTFMGIENANTDKKERMISNEVASNNGQVTQFKKAALMPRQKACEEINLKYGLNIWCEWNEEASVPELEEAELGGI